MMLARGVLVGWGLLTLGLAALLSLTRGAPPTDDILFVTERNQGWHIYRMGADGSNPRPIARTGNYWALPAWSPDGETVYFADASEGRFGLFRVSSTGGEPQRVLHTPGEAFSPRPSPNGLWLVYRVRGGPIYAMRPDGRDLHIALNDRSTLGDVNWSADGRWLVYVAPGTSGRGDIFRWRWRSNRAPQQLTSHPQHDSMPSPSPDGRWIAFMSRRNGAGDIYLMRFDGGDLRRLTDDPADDLYPAWTADGEWLVFVSRRGDDSDIYAMRPDGRDLHNLTHHPGIDRTPAPAPLARRAWHPLGPSLAGLGLLGVGLFPRRCAAHA